MGFNFVGQVYKIIIGHAAPISVHLDVFEFYVADDARFANSMYADWGVTYTTVAQLSSTLNRCDFTFSVDISDAYHLALWAGCGGELRPTRRPVVSTAADARTGRPA